MSSVFLNCPNRLLSFCHSEPVEEQSKKHLMLRNDQADLLKKIIT